MLVAAIGVYGVSASPAFGLANVEISGLRYSDETEVRDSLAVPTGTNLFGLPTEPLEARLLELPTIAGATVAARLPGTLDVRIDERVPVLVWLVGERRFLVDAAGVLFSELGPRPGEDAAALPVVDDQRATGSALVVGTTLDPVDRDAATQLGSLKPSDVGSAARGLAIQVTDVNGFVVRARPSGWQAVFGFYTPSLRTPAMIPGQVRSLRSLLLEQGERNVARVVLASEGAGTFTTPPPSPSP